MKKKPDALAALLHEKRKDADGNPVSLLDHHLRVYTRNNSSDFFIHKDLNGFLERELDFYLKNEVLNLDELESGGEVCAESWFQTMRAIKGIGRKIIAFVAQIENFQKRLFEKAKFVTEVHYCVTLDRVPKELYSEITKNKAQIAEWKRLFHIQEIKRDTTQPGFSEPLKAGFLEAHQSLVLDTRFFQSEFLDTLLASKSFLGKSNTIEDAATGLLIRADNFHAPQFILPLYARQLAMVYADPPYNTGTDEFIYKDAFQHSTWLCMMASRLALYVRLLRDDAALFLSLDDSELHRAICLLETSISPDGHLATFARRTKSGGGSAADAFAVEHDYVVAWAKAKASAKEFFIRHDEEYVKRYSEKDSDGPYFWDTMERSSTATTPYVIEAPDGTKLKGRWFRSESRFLKDLAKGDARIVKLAKGSWSVQFKQRLAPGRKLRSLMYENEYKSQPSDLGDLGMADDFPYPKPLFLIQRLVESATFFERKSAVVADFFAGSGTTGHAVIAMNREDGGNRKYILGEMGEHFDLVIKPRLQKVIYSKDWKDGKPVSRQGSSHAFKYLRLESYEDALDNISFQPTDDQTMFQLEDYVLSYLLDFETKHSETLLNVAKLDSPFDYKLRRHGKDDPLPVHLPETFNYLIGLHVTSRTVHDNKGARYLIYRGKANGREAVILWRTTRGWGKKEFQADRDFVAKHKITEGAEDVLVNTDSYIEGARSLDPIFKCRMFNEE